MNHGRRFSLPLPKATRALFWLNVAVFAANALLLGRLSERTAGGGGAWFAFSWPGLLDGYGLGLLRVLTYQFTHAFSDPLHLLMNMVALWVFGPMAEARLGATGTVRLYLWGGLLGALGHVATCALQGQLAVSLAGASGACYALLVYAACVAPRATIVFFIVQMPLWGLAALLVGLGAYTTFVELASGYSGGVSHSAHLGGALIGFVAHRAGWFVDWLDVAGETRPGPFTRLRAALQRRRTARGRAHVAATELQLDTILAKVKAEGIGSLQEHERRFLERLSARSKSGGS